tara:strand:- start:298 stop:660 length:363 start_codon:yes stop_codon:yes gene_type:complete
MNCLLELELLIKTKKIKNYLEDFHIISKYKEEAFVRYVRSADSNIISINTEEGYRYVPQGMVIEDIINKTYENSSYSNKFFKSMKYDSKRLKKWRKRERKRIRAEEAELISKGLIEEDDY